MLRLSRPLLLMAISIVFTACSGGGGGSSSSTSNNPPVADAGSDKTTEQNQTVQISGSGNDSDGSITSYQWKKGTAVLSNSASFSYTPTTVGNHTLTLTVTDDDGATDSDLMTVTVTQKVNTVHITDENYQVEKLGRSTHIRKTVSIDTLTPKSLYLVLSNNANASDTPIITHDAKSVSVPQSKTNATNDTPAQRPNILHAPERIRNFGTEIKSLITSGKMVHTDRKAVSVLEDAEGNTTSFCTDIEGSSPYDCTQRTPSTAKKVVKNISTNVGTKTLNIWVADDSFGARCPKKECVTQEMVDALASYFLKTGTNNDIYDWVTNVFGEEWGSGLPSYYIGKDDEITILLYDIDDDNSSNGGVVGYFWSKDNLTETYIKGSNQRIMFYIDAVMFANGDGASWDIDHYWPKELVSTLAHEFQHMIHYYQKNILQNADADTWINEMLSESTEDLIATKIKHVGPRGVDHEDGTAGDAPNYRGRYPGFNGNINNFSLTNWNYSIEDYSKVNAFGAYLLRNYGGAQLLHDIMHNPYSDEQAIVYAVRNSLNGSDETFDDLLSEWGVAVMLSEYTNLVDLPIYNDAGWINSGDTYNGISYELGSINFFNYAPQPDIDTSINTIQPKGNYYYKIGDNLSGTVTLDLQLNGETEAVLIAK